MTAVTLAYYHTCGAQVVLPAGDVLAWREALIAGIEEKSRSETLSERTPRIRARENEPPAALRRNAEREKRRGLCGGLARQLPAA